MRPGSRTASGQAETHPLGHWAKDIVNLADLRLVFQEDRGVEITVEWAPQTGFRTLMTAILFWGHFGRRNLVVTTSLGGKGAWK